MLRFLFRKHNIAEILLEDYDRPILPGYLPVPAQYCPLPLCKMRCLCIMTFMTQLLFFSGIKSICWWTSWAVNVVARDVVKFTSVDSCCVLEKISRALDKAAWTQVTLASSRRSDSWLSLSFSSAFLKSSSLQEIQCRNKSWVRQCNLRTQLHENWTNISARRNCGRFGKMERA